MTEKNEIKNTDAKKKKTNALNINIKNMGIDIDKNEYREIILSNSNHPESSYGRKNYFD